MNAKFMFLMAACLMLTACADQAPQVDNSRTPYQTITVNTPGMEGVTCVAQSGRETYTVTAPGAVTVKRAPYTMEVNCFKGEHLRGQARARPNYALKEAQRIATSGEACLSCNYPRTVTVAMRIDQESMSDTVRIFDGR